MEINWVKYPISIFLVHQHFSDEIISLYSPGMVRLLVFKKHIPANLKLVNDDENDDMDECVRKVGIKETKETKSDFKYYSKYINREMVSESASTSL